MSKNDYLDIRRAESLATVQQEEPARLAPTATTALAVAQIKALENNLMAGLAKQTMDNTAFLAMYESHCIREAPEGAEEYQRIVRGYAQAAMELIWGGER